MIIWLPSPRANAATRKERDHRVGRPGCPGAYRPHAEDMRKTQETSAAIHPLLFREIEQRDTDMTEHLRSGSVSDVGDLKFHQGYLRAIEDIVTSAEQVHTRLTSQEKPRAASS